jgi:anti-sigma factor RsiW
MTGRTATCRRYRRALEEFVDRGEHGPSTATALEHLSRCRTCEREMTELALTIAALRRAGRDLRAAPVPVIAPARVAALTVRPRSPWSFRLQLGSLVTGAAIAALVVLPQAGGLSRPVSDALSPAQATAAGWRVAEFRLAAAPDRPSFAAPSALPPRYPEGRTRPWKEVFPTDATPREFEPR